MTTELKSPQEQYLDAKWVVNNPNKFDYRDVARAREFVSGFKAALTIAQQAVGELKSAYEDGTEIDGLIYCDAEPDQAVNVLYNVLTRIKTLTETE